MSMVLKTQGPSLGTPGVLSPLPHTGLDQTGFCYPGSPAITLDDGAPNILVFGETGTGKSSIINMLIGHDVAKSSPDARGCTFTSRPYDLSLAQADGTQKHYRIWDTAGLNEDEAGTVTPMQAIHNLLKLAEETRGRLHLLVYCIRATRYHDVIKDNYNLFYKFVAQQQVPIVLLITGCENFERMDKWWEENKSVFGKYGLTFDGVGCITATRGKWKGKEWIYEEQYEESCELAKGLIREHCMSDGHSLPTTAGGVKSAWNKVKSTFSSIPPTLPKESPGAEILPGIFSPPVSNAWDEWESSNTFDGMVVSQRLSDSESGFIDWLTRLYLFVLSAAVVVSMTPFAKAYLRG